MGAGIVGHEELPFDIEDGEREFAAFDSQRIARFDLCNAAQFDLGRHHALHGTGCENRNSASIMAAGSAVPLPAMSCALPCATEANRIGLPMVTAEVRLRARSFAAM